MTEEQSNQKILEELKKQHFSKGAKLIYKKPNMKKGQILYEYGDGKIELVDKNSGEIIVIKKGK